VFKIIPVNQDQDLTLVAILELGKTFAETEKNKSLIKEINQILENIKSLETEGIYFIFFFFASFKFDFCSVVQV
jgi:hypothetical protein